jgi:hypothetical protein
VVKYSLEIKQSAHKERRKKGAKAWDALNDRLFARAVLPV